MNQIYQDKKKTVVIAPEAYFNAMCKEYDLKPELKDIYLIADKVIISIDGYRKIVRRTYPDYYVKIIVVSDGDKVRIEGNEIKAEITFKKMSKENILGAYAIGSRTEGGELNYKYVEFADFYVPGVTRDNKYVPSMWDKIPVAMISKVAESTILRMLCNELGGTYIPEEYSHVDEQPKKLVVKSSKKEDVSTPPVVNEYEKPTLSEEEFNSPLFTNALERYLKDNIHTADIIAKIKARYTLTPSQEATILNLK